MENIEVLIVEYEDSKSSQRPPFIKTGMEEAEINESTSLPIASRQNKGCGEGGFQWQYTDP
jgi:hypothetical protein